MSHDESGSGGREAVPEHGDQVRNAGGMPDEGMIHEWLDGQLDPSSAARLEQLVRESPVFAEQVAEARGLIAGSARVLLSLDSVPAGVLPAGIERSRGRAASPASAGAEDHEHAGASTADVRLADERPTDVRPMVVLGGTPVRRVAPVWRRWGAAAALLMIGVTGAVVVQRTPQSERQLGDVAASGEALAAAESAVDGRADSASSSGPQGRPASDRPAGGRPAGGRPAGGSPVVAAAAEERLEVSAAVGGASSAPVAADATEPARRRAAMTPEREMAVGRAASPESLASPATRVAERVAADASLRPSIEPMRQSLAAGAPVAASRAAGTPPAGAPAAAAPEPAAARISANALAAKSSGARVAESAPPSFPEVVSDIPPAELAFAVQRVACAPACVQLRFEIARDGRVRRYTRASLMGPAEVDSGRVAETAVAAVQQLADSLELAALPPTLSLNSGRCPSLAALRESLQVEFVVNGRLRRVLGLPWCSDGSHPLDQVARAVESAVRDVIGR